MPGAPPKPHPTPGWQVTPVPPTHLHVSERLHQGNDLQLIQHGQVQDLLDFGGAAGTQMTQRRSHSSIHTGSHPRPLSASLSGSWGTVTESEWLSRYSEGSEPFLL